MISIREASPDPRGPAAISGERSFDGRPDLAAITRVAWRLFVALALAFFLAGAGYDASEGLSDYELAQHFVRTGEIGLPQAKGPIFDRGPDGRLYLAHEFGNPLALTPMVALGNGLNAVVGRYLPSDHEDRLASFLATVNSQLAVAAVVTGAFWIFTACLGLPVRTALTACAGLAFGSMLFPYSRLGTDLVLGSALVVLAVAAAWSHALWPRAWLAAVVGALLAYAFITRMTAALFVPALAAYLGYLAWRRERRARPVLTVLLLVGAPLVLALVWQGWYNHVRTGNFLQPSMLSPRYAMHNTMSSSNPLDALAGVLASPGKSLFLFSPVLIAGVPGWKRFFARRRAECLCLAGVILPYFLFHCLWRHWSGDWAWGPRLFLPLVALLFLPAAYWLREGVAGGRRVWAALLLLGVLVQGAGVWNNWQFRFGVVYARSGPWLEPMIWDPAHSLLLDCAANVGRNIQRMAGTREWERIAGSSPLHSQAANTINVWWANVPVRGTARGALLLFVALLLLADLALWRALLRGSAQAGPVPLPQPREAERLAS